MLCMGNFGSQDNLDLKALDRVLDVALERYKNYLSENWRKYANQDVGINHTVKLEKRGGLRHTPEKPNTARTEVDIIFADGSKELMYAILFMPGDGTGDASKYKPGQLELPEYLRSIDKVKERPESVLPRKKDCAAEVLFPLFSIKDFWEVYENTVSLDELTVDSTETPKKIIKAWNLGEVRTRYERVMVGKASIIRHPYHVYTTGYETDGKRFGDPHAIFNSTQLMQVVGFISYNDGNFWKMFGKGL